MAIRRRDGEKTPSPSQSESSDQQPSSDANNSSTPADGDSSPPADENSSPSPPSGESPDNKNGGNNNNDNGGNNNDNGENNNNNDNGGNNNNDNSGNNNDNGGNSYNNGGNNNNGDKNNNGESNDNNNNTNNNNDDKNNNNGNTAEENNNNNDGKNNNNDDSKNNNDNSNTNNGNNDSNNNDNNNDNSTNNNNGGQNNNNNNNNQTNPNSQSNSNSQSPPSHNKHTTSQPPPSNHSHSGSKGAPRSPPPPALESEEESPSESSNAPIIVGVVLGVGVLLVILLIVFLCIRKSKKKKKKAREAMQYYDYRSEQKPPYGGQTPPQPPWGMNQGPPGMHPQDMGMNYSGGPGMPSANWGPAMPPPPPPQMMSSDMSSANYSGGPPMPPPHPGVALGFNKSTFSYEELAAATGNFANSNMLGQGGFGYVHKGVLPNGKEIAVKSLKSGSGQGDREFQAEVEIISRVHHRHLVSLAGYCVAGGQRMLVYEFIDNNTLEYHLHGKGRPVMDFPTRMRIALGSAKGLAYLHEDCHPRIIHRDIKTANILIDMSFEAKVADFGLAKLNDANVTHVSTRVMGTFGYLAPEYAASGKLTEKSDVFSFGVMLLELVTGRRPIDVSDDEDTLVDWARPLLPRALEDGVFEGLVDPKLEGNYNQQEMLRLIACAGASIRHSGKRRPKMSQIVRALEGDASLEDLNEVKKQSTPFSPSSGSDYDTVCYNNDMKQFRKMVLDSSEYATSTNFAPTNEYKK